MVIILLRELTANIWASTHRGTPGFALPEQVARNRLLVVRHLMSLRLRSAGATPPQFAMNAWSEDPFLDIS
jgi:hypothetical protein